MDIFSKHQNCFFLETSHQPVGKKIPKNPRCDPAGAVFQETLNDLSERDREVGFDTVGGEVGGWWLLVMIWWVGFFNFIVFFVKRYGNHRCMGVEGEEVLLENVFFFLGVVLQRENLEGNILRNHWGCSPFEWAWLLACWRRMLKW